MNITIRTVVSGAIGIDDLTEAPSLALIRTPEGNIINEPIAITTTIRRGYYIPAKFTSKSVPKEKEDSWSLFLRWFNVSAIAGLLILSYFHKLLWKIRG